jgi:hypothetical protein
MAVGLAQVFASGHKNVDESILGPMREYFSNAELVELIAFMSFMWAGGMFGRVFGVEPASSLRPDGDVP